MRPKRRDQPRGDVMRFRHQPAPGKAALFLERLEDQCFLLGAHAFHRADTAVARRLLQVGERAHAEVAVEPRHRLGSDALEVQQIQHRGRKFLQQVLVVADHAGVHQLADLGGDVFTDARQREPLGRRQAGDAVRLVRDRLARVAIRADLERVLSLDLEEIANLGQHARDRQVFHVRVTRR
jgi:hypothetical protein